MFMLIAFLIYFGGFVYIAWRINAGFNLQAPYKWYLLTGTVLLGVLSIIAFIGSRVSFPGVSFIGPLGYICMGVWGIFITFFILNDIANAVNLILKIKSFRYYSTLITLGISVLACVWSLINVAFILKIKEVKIKVPELNVESLRIVQLSDLHINSFTSHKKIRDIFEKVMTLNPDIILITGDVIDTDINKNDAFRDYGFEVLQAPHGVFAITGNHEYYTGLQAFFGMFAKLGVKTLQNESVTIDGLINVSGINDHEFRNPSAITKALSGADPSLPTLFMSHQPEAFDIASEQGKSIIQFSGHTHAGQIPPVEIVRRLMKYNYGLYENKDSKMYITSGTRWWGPPMRLANSSEIVVVTLVKE